MRLDHAAIEALVPHRGPMCLLYTMESWSGAGIVCSANNFRDLDHPLRSRSGLLATAAIEYAAQAMALHGALLGRAAGEPPSAGYLASARGVALSRWRLDDLPVDASRLRHRPHHPRSLDDRSLDHPSLDDRSLHDLSFHGLPLDEPAFDAATAATPRLRPTPPFDSDMLRIEATRQAGDARQILYVFTLDHRSVRIAEGRAAVVLNTALAMRRPDDPRQNET